MIKEIFDNFVRSAEQLGDYQAMSKTELANGYCDADEVNDPTKRDQYFSALMLRYWFKVKEFAEHSQFARLELDDFVSWVSESLMVAFKYRRWRDPSHPLSKDPDGPQKVFNQALFSTQKRWLNHFNKIKRRVNYVAESIDHWYSNQDSLGKKDELAHKIFYESGNYSTIPVQGPSHGIVQKFLNSGKIVEALVIDSIAHQDAFSLSDGAKQYTFKKENVYTNLKQASDSYLNYFKTTYNVDNDTLIKTVDKLNKMSKKQILYKIKKTISSTKKNPYFLEMLKESFNQ